MSASGFELALSDTSEWRQSSLEADMSNGVFSFRVNGHFFSVTSVASDGSIDSLLSLCGDSPDDSGIDSLEVVGCEHLGENGVRFGSFSSEHHA